MDAAFVRIHHRTVVFLRKSQESLGFPAQTPRYQSDRIKIELPSRVISLLKFLSIFCCEFTRQFFRIFLRLLNPLLKDRCTGQQKCRTMPFACCRWTIWGQYGGGSRALQNARFSHGFPIVLVRFLARAREILDFLLKH
jgi:hypothetical protein